MITLNQLLLSAAALAALQFLLALWLSERLKAALARETGLFLESMRWDTKVREQAEKVAEYMALANFLKVDGSPDQYERANRLAWELALWLPPELYRAVTKAMSSPSEETNPLSVLIDVRKHLLKSTAGNLTQDEILFHAPNAGRKRS
ncbi:MAG: hypothetical protein ACYCY0_02450 [Acidithiobacillus ferrivorans]